LLSNVLDKLRFKKFATITIIMRRVASFEGLKKEFENYLETGVEKKRLIVYFTDEEAMKNLSSYYRSRVIDKPPVEYVQRIVRKGCLLLPKDGKPVIGGEKKPKKESNTRLYFMDRNRYAYFDIYGCREPTILKKVKLRKLILKLPIMPLKEYFSNMGEIWDLEGEMNVKICTLLSEYMGLGDNSKILPLIETKQLEFRDNFDDVVFQ
jgi:hypothetical protein